MASVTHHSVDKTASPAQVRAACREGRFVDHTSSLAPGYAQANLAIVPKSLAYDFLLFCHRNPQPCPVLEVTEVGHPEPVRTAPGADLRTDLPRYRVFRHGELIDEPTDISGLWDHTLVGFLLGCSLTFEESLQKAGVPLRNREAGTVDPMYRTNIACAPAGDLKGNMIVSMRMIPSTHIVRAVQVTSRFPAVHGAPVHIGDPALIGISDLDDRAAGDPPVSEPGDVPVFWACGVTPQAIAMQVKPELMITHAPAHMFITDTPSSYLAVL